MDFVVGEQVEAVTRHLVRSGRFHSGMSALGDGSWNIPGHFSPYGMYKLQLYDAQLGYPVLAYSMAVKQFHIDAMAASVKARLTGFEQLGFRCPSAAMEVHGMAHCLAQLKNQRGALSHLLVDGDSSATAVAKAHFPTCQLLRCFNHRVRNLGKQCTRDAQSKSKPVAKWTALANGVKALLPLFDLLCIDSEPYLPALEALVTLCESHPGCCCILASTTSARAA